MNSEQMLFLRAVVLAAQTTMRDLGVPASVTIAQAILESGWGRTSLAAKCNNYFGIKDTDHESYIEFPTKEYVDGKAEIVKARFEVYATVEIGFKMHARLLAGVPRYGPAMAVKNDPLKFCDALEACGYSTNPQYAETLRKLIAQFDLMQYDIVTA